MLTEVNGVRPLHSRQIARGVCTVAVEVCVIAAENLWSLLQDAQCATGELRGKLTLSGNGPLVKVITTRNNFFLTGGSRSRWEKATVGGEGVGRLTEHLK